MISEFELTWKKKNLECFPNVSHFEYFIDGVNLKEIIDAKYGFNAFVEKNEFVGWINEKLDFKNLEISGRILKGEKINEFLLTESKSLNYKFESQIPLYTCLCGDINYNGLMVNIDISGNNIIWDFKDEVMPIVVFDLKQYRKEIDLKIVGFKRNKYNNR
ncbi:hypothetical protein [Tenacibaculum sp. M341]|uniref:hypothetical protein n=1 Tax=Tenacibaculum sp. M341 TaxID=2530339 RepID=UPI0010516396|nr:hypothetical protein [Tenacibaculum sp. M341]TCI91807.1 hypothetical protein EYW44_09650 [Tenacibaculum sp. M341]